VRQKPAESEQARVTQRVIARAAKVSVMTVSYALRDSPEVSARERVRIKKIADQLGYRPDPLLTHLMQHLRSQRTLKPASNLAALTMLDAGFVRRLLTGARARAERLGYHLDLIDARIYVNKAAPLTRTLLARGVAGVLLAPTVEPINFRELLDWSRFAAVAMTYSVFEPHVHRVVTHHFDNAVRTFALLEQRGYRRIGLAMTQDMEFRANHSYGGAHQRTAGMSPNRPPPILLLDRSGHRGIRAWFEQHRPDAVVVANAHQVRDYFLPALGSRACGRTGFACLDYEDGAGISGMDQLFEIIGSHALDALVAQIHRNERGLPENPTISMVEGHWIDVRGPYSVD
jgi:DNA-binding LacI/PurR family transcriptional regulator